jgi:hypothetical protein
MLTEAQRNHNRRMRELRRIIFNPISEEELAEVRTIHNNTCNKVKDSLNEAIEIRSARTRQRRSLISKEFETLSYEDKRNYMYQKSRVGIMANDVRQANKLERDNIESRIFARKQKIEKRSRNECFCSYEKRRGDFFCYSKSI